MFTIYLPNAYHIHTNVLGDVCATKIQEDLSPTLKDTVFIIYCCKTNYTKTHWLKMTTINLEVNISHEFKWSLADASCSGSLRMAVKMSTKASVI